VPVLFLRLRQAESFEARMRQVERVLRLLWSLLLFVLLAYWLVGARVILLFFGASYLPSLGPTRIMLMTSLMEVLLQILIQQLMSSGLMRRYALLLNGGTLLAALAVWILVPRLGLQGFLIVKALVAILPLLAAARQPFVEAGRLLPLLLITVAITLYVFAAYLLPLSQGLQRPVFALVMVVLVLAYHRDYRDLLVSR
jgi:O-antigen/teichoic acid export membrane protein